jgi:type IV secretion system protein VirB1
MAIDAAAAVTVPAIGAAIRHVAPIPTPTPSDPMAVDSFDANSGHAAPTGSDQANASAAPALAAGQASIASAANVNDAVFVPEVRGPGDPTDGSTPMEPIPTMTQATLSHAGADRADLRQEQRDDAFVF